MNYYCDGDYLTKRELIYELSYETGYGLCDCERALSLCHWNKQWAYNYLRIFDRAVSRYKVVDGVKIPWTTEDFVEAAKPEGEE